jgi:hypothetical protein
VDDNDALSFGPFDKMVALFACLSAFAPSLRTVGLGPMVVVGFGTILVTSLMAGTCSGAGASTFASVAVLVSWAGVCTASP